MEEEEEDIEEEDDVEAEDELGCNELDEIFDDNQPLLVYQECNIQISSNEVESGAS